MENGNKGDNVVIGNNKELRKFKMDSGVDELDMELNHLNSPDGKFELR